MKKSVWFKMCIVFMIGIFGADYGDANDNKTSINHGSKAPSYLSNNSDLNRAKYVFLFIGDGMASPQIHATEAYLASLLEDNTVPGGRKAEKLHMSTFPIQGMQMSYANNRFITGSAAASTALGCGKKTNIGVIAMDPDGKIPLKTIAEAAKEKGMKVGIVSSVSIDHATPAAFYAHQPIRNNYEEIGFELLNKNFDYFAGGGFRVNKWTSPEYADLSNVKRYEVVEKTAVANGFVYANTRSEFEALNKKSGRVIAVNPYLDSSNAMPYAINRISASGKGETYEGSISLAEFTSKGVELLSNRNGFFMMVEGGKIDWACHANDARAAIEDMLAFDDAVKVAMDFAKKYPKETLIVVTGDHECGGMSLGFAGTGYDTFFEKIANQTVAYDDFVKYILAAYRDSHDPVPANVDADMWQIIFDYYSLDGSGLSPYTEDDFTPYEISLVQAAFEKTFHATTETYSEKDILLYGSYNPLSVTLTHLLNRKAGLSWTTFSHTAVPVPVMALGLKAWLFNGYYDNTDIALKISKAMGIRLFK